MQKDVDLEMSLKTLHQILSSENLKENLVNKALIKLLSTIQINLELQKGYLAALKGTAQRVCESQLINQSQAKETLGHQLVILSEALEMTWNMSDSLSYLTEHLAREKN